jgi:hypothetical protein
MTAVVTELTIEDALADIHTQVERFGPGYIYHQPAGACIYQYNGAASCLIGQILKARGVSIDLLRALDTGRSEVRIVMQELGYNHHARDTLIRAQQWQDDQIPWGEVEQLTREWVTTKAVVWS